MRSLVARYYALTNSLQSSWYPIPLRMIVGFGFMQHGYAKLARGAESFANLLHALHVPMPWMMSWLTILIELVGGFAVFVGALLSLVSIPMAVVLLVAIFTVHLPNGFSSIKLLSYDASGAHFGQPGYETDLLYLASLLALCLGGAGPLSVDKKLRQTWKHTR
jgi:putative oxidoreductase